MPGVSPHPRTAAPRSPHRHGRGTQDGPGVVMRSGVIRVGILGEDDELARIVGPIAEGVKVDGASHRGCCGRGLNPRERVAVSHTPPSIHSELPARSNFRGATVHRNQTGNHGERRGTTGAVPAKGDGPSIDIPCWTSRRSLDIPRARKEGYVTKSVPTGNPRHPCSRPRAQAVSAKSAQAAAESMKQCGSSGARPGTTHDRSGHKPLCILPTRSADAQHEIHTVTKQTKRTNPGDAANAFVRVILSNAGAMLGGLKEHEWRKTLEWFDGRCAYTGRSLADGETERDHAIPMNRTHCGLHLYGNVVPATQEANRRKAGTHYREFIEDHDRLERIDAFLCASMYWERVSASPGPRERRRANTASRATSAAPGGLTTTRAGGATDARRLTSRRASAGSAPPRRRRPPDGGPPSDSDCRTRSHDEGT